MQKPITPFNRNIEILRDIAETIGLQYLNNGNDNISFAITEYGRIQVMIRNHRYSDNNNIISSVCVEYQGDGVMTIQPCDGHGHVIGDKYELYDTHWPGNDHVKIFHDMIKKKFNIRI